MAHVFMFRSSRFDTGAETPNPINPIAGQSLLLWLGERLRDSRFQASAPSTEDWGWYVDVTGEGASYLVGASAEPDGPGAEIDWTLQVEKHRSFTDKLRSANKMLHDDPLSLLIEQIFRAEPTLMQLDVDKDA